MTDYSNINSFHLLQNPKITDKKLKFLQANAIYMIKVTFNEQSPFWQPHLPELPPVSPDLM